MQHNKQTQEQAEFKLIVLQACKVKEPMGAYKGYYSTLFYKDGKQFAKIPAEQDQPRKGCKTYILNCFTYGIEWIDTPFDRTPTPTPIPTGKDAGEFTKEHWEIGHYMNEFSIWSAGHGGVCKIPFGEGDKNLSEAQAQVNAKLLCQAQKMFNLLNYINGFVQVNGNLNILKDTTIANGILDTLNSTGQPLQ